MNASHLVKPALILGGLLAGSALPVRAQTTDFFFTSSPQSWIGQGQSLLASSANGYSINLVSGLSQYEVAFAIVPPNPATGDWWWIEMDDPQGTSPYLTDGLYENAVGLGGNAGPGLSFYGSGRGDNTSTGYFDVLDITYGPDHTVLSFAADFVQYDVGITTDWNEGSIRYNSTIPITVPEPATPALLALGLGLGMIKLKRQVAGQRKAAMMDGALRGHSGQSPVNPDRAGTL